jgi:hypothetical protein
MEKAERKKQEKIEEVNVEFKNGEKENPERKRRMTKMFGVCLLTLSTIIEREDEGVSVGEGAGEGRWG